MSDLEDPSARARGVRYARELEGHLSWLDTFSGTAEHFCSNCLFRCSISRDFCFLVVHAALVSCGARRTGAGRVDGRDGPRLYRDHRHVQLAQRRGTCRLCSG